MAYEIYYTSATQGLKRGSQGFCTVAATEGIPAALLQRLEALSGYRHHFGPGDTSGGKNPVNHAHWTLNLAGKTYHVLSRISDAGVDYTHRTNSLAHHIALEPHELPPAGPAWLLAQPGVMIDHWNGEVGPIVRTTPLPFWDMPPSRCDAWERLTGDAGWGGMPDEALTKGSGKPVCVLLNPDQDVLELIDESIRLLPAALRWQATFNTYFTSMPQSVACAWRCCLAGTPAAQAAVRYAANGVVINLADASALGEAPANAWVEAARTGIAPSLTAVKMPVAAAASRRGVVHVAVPPAMPTQIPDPLPPPSQSYDELVAANLALKVADARRIKPQYQGSPEPPLVVNKELDALARRHRRQMALLYIAAVGAIGIGVLLVLRAGQPSPVPSIAPPPVIPASLPAASPKPVQPVIEPVVPVAPYPLIVNRPVPHPAIVPTVVRPPPPPPPVIAPEQTIVLRGPLNYASTGSGLTDATQDIDIPPADAQRLRTANALRLVFPGDRPAYPYKHGDVSGILSAASLSGAAPGLSLLWKDNAAPSPDGAEILTLTLDAARAQVHITWRNSLLIRRPDVGVLAFWLVQESTLLADDPGQSTPHHIAFGSVQPQIIDVMDSSTTLHFRSDLPPDCVLSAAAGQLPAGWTAALIPASDKEPNIQVLLLNKHTRVSVLDAVFHLTLRPGWTLSSDFAEQHTQAAAGPEKFQKDIANLDDQIKQLNEDADHDMADVKKELAQDQALRGKSEAVLDENNFTRASLRQAIEDLSDQLAERRAKLEQDRAPLSAKRNDLDQLRQGYQEVSAALDELTAFDLSVALPDGTPIATLHFTHK